MYIFPVEASYHPVLQSFSHEKSNSDLFQISLYSNASDLFHWPTMILFKGVSIKSPCVRPPTTQVGTN